MALEKVISVDLIEIVESGCIQVRTKTAIKEDGVVLQLRDPGKKGASYA
jgi:hypothetical protein